MGTVWMIDSGSGERDMINANALMLRCIAFYHYAAFPCLLLFTASSATRDKISIKRGAKKTIAVFTIESVSDQKALQKGLAGRQSIPDKFGMLFILDNTSKQYFWMKGMEFPIDILFFNKDKRLTQILPNLLPCEKCSIYEAPAGTAYALEINAGIADVLGLKTGDSFVFTDK
jgi:uncharacterized membrane protein (UPF0127 family)